MDNQFNLFPLLDDSLKSRAEITMDESEFSYTDDNEDFTLELKEKNENGTSYTGYLRDQRCVWYPETHNLKVKISGSIKNPSLLFGPEGIVCHDAHIGIGIQWISTKTDHRGIVRCKDMKSSDRECNFNTLIKFDKNFVKGSIQLNTILYLKKEGNPDENERHLNNISGTILGVIESCEVFVDGNGSIFPVSTVNKPGEPLWWVYYDTSADPMTDSFEEENVELIMNSAHPNFSLLKIDSSMKESVFLVEILSAAMVIIIDSAKEALGSEWESMIDSKDFSTGSIAEALYYFKNKLMWDFSDPSALSLSIHDYFDKNL